MNGYRVAVPSPTLSAPSLLIRRASAIGLLFFLLACNAPAFSAQGQWIKRASMVEKRSWMSLATLNDKIYAIGGMNGADGQRLDINEVFDPRANAWQLLAPLPTARTSADTAVIGNLIYVIGGYAQDGTTDRVEAFDTLTNGWRTDFPPMPTKRFDLATTAIGNVIYAAGGFDNEPLDVFEAYDTALKKWTALPPLPTARYAMQAIVIDGEIFVIGGRTAQDATDVVEVYDPQTRLWSSPTRVPEPLSGFGATMAEGVLHIVKYDKHFTYDPKNGHWQTGLAPMPSSRHGLRLAYIDGLLYAVGGCLTDSNGLFDLARNEAYIVRAPRYPPIK